MSEADHRADGPAEVIVLIRETIDAVARAQKVLYDVGSASSKVLTEAGEPTRRLRNCIDVELPQLEAIAAQLK